MEKKTPRLDKPTVKFVFTEFGQGLPGEPFPLGVYPAFDDDMPRDSTFENSDLRDIRPYPRGLK